MFYWWKEAYSKHGQKTYQKNEKSCFRNLCESFCKDLRNWSTNHEMEGQGRLNKIIRKWWWLETKDCMINGL